MLGVAAGVGMAFTLLVLVVAIALGYARGGRMYRIAEARLRWPSLLFAGLLVQAATDAFAARGAIGASPTYWGLLVSQLIVLVWVVANLGRPGMPVVLLGLVANAVVIAANGAMPVDPDAIAAVGHAGAAPLPGKHELLTPATRLAFLADTWALVPIKTIISVGDVILAAGLVPLVHDLMTSRPDAPPDHALADEEPA